MKFFELQNENSKLMLTQFAPNTSDPRLHDHGDEYQISIPLIGVPGIQIGGQVGQIFDKQRVVTAPGEAHLHFSGDSASRLLLINIQRSYVEQVLADRLQQAVHSPVEFATWGEGASDGFRKIADHLIKQTMVSSLERTEMQQLEWQLAQLLLESQAGSHSEQLRDQGPLLKHPALQVAIDYIHESYGTKMSLDQLAELAGISKYHLIRLFREQVGSTPSHYLSEVRLGRAEWLLRHTTQDVTAIAFEVGFGSLSAFERAFKLKYGVSANVYRKQIE